MTDICAHNRNTIETAAQYDRFRLEVSAKCDVDGNIYFVLCAIRCICMFLCLDCSICSSVFVHSHLCAALLDTALALMVSPCLWECLWQVCVVIESVSAASLESCLTYGGICVLGICAQSAAQATIGLDTGFMHISLGFLGLSNLIPVTVGCCLPFSLYFSSLLHTCTPFCSLLHYQLPP